MSQILLDKSIGILIVEPTMSIASTIRRVFIENGYQNAYLADSVPNAFNTVGSNRVDWIFASSFGDQKLNLWHCLRLPLEAESFPHVHVSALLDEEQLADFETYYSLGAVTLHPRALTYNTFAEELLAFLERLKTFPNLQAAIGADLRRRYKTVSSWKRLEELESQLYAKFDPSPQQRLRLIEAQLLAENKIEAMLGLRELQESSPQLAPELKAMSRTFIGTDDIKSFRGKFEVASALVLDPDEAQQKYLREVLGELGVDRIVCCSTLEEGCSALHENDEYDLVVTEWRLQKVEGHAFIQHVRQHGHATVPVLIYSALVKPEDKPLIEEIRGVFVLNKPSTKKVFKQSVVEFVERWRYPQQASEVEERLINMIDSGRIVQAKGLNQSFQKEPKVEAHRKEYVNAAIDFAEGRYPEAKERILQASKMHVPGHKEISLLGKILLRLGDPANALRFLEQANQMVPGNIDRMCELADASSGTGQLDKALQVATEARKIGGDIGQVHSAYLRHAVAAGQPLEGDMLESEDDAREVVAHMNNLGIAFAASQNWEGSATAYKRALSALGEQHKGLTAIVYYNYGLSLARQGKLSEAVQALSKVGDDPSMNRKANDLRDRAKKALDQGVPLQLKENVREIAAPIVGKLPELQASYIYKARRDVHALYRAFDFLQLGSKADIESELPKFLMKKKEVRDEGVSEGEGE